MAHCPYCLSPVSAREFVCHTCGAEKGYLYFNRRSRGLTFLLTMGLLAPLIAAALIVYMQGTGMAFGVTVAVVLGLGIFTVHRLIAGPNWYR